MISISDKEGTAVISRPFLITADFLVPLLVLITATLLFSLSDLDLRLQDRLFGDGGKWTYGQLPLFQLLYRYGNLPALFSALGGLFVFALGYKKQRWLKYRKVGAFLILCLILGPGLVVNALLKDNWGRPRPRDLERYGGKFAYEAPLQIDSSSPGKSFPCGHATVGYYFFAFYFLLRGRRRSLALMFLFFAMIYGTLIGFVRIAQGGHFASDVIWSGALIYLCSYILFRAMRMHRGVFYEPQLVKVHTALKLYQKAALIVLALVVAAGVSLATPYSRHRNLELSGKLPSDIPVRIEVNMPIGDLVIRQSDHLALLYASSGFGLPGSKLSFPQELKLQDSLAIIRISQNKRGFFTELGSKAELTLDSTRVTHLDIRLNGGELTAKLDKAAPPVSLFLANEKGGVTLFLPRPFTRLLSIQGTPKEVYVAKDIIHSRTLESDSTIPYRIKINQGKVIVK